MNNIRKRITEFFYDKDTDNMLNYITLNVSNKEVRKDIDQERAERINKIYFIILLVCSIGFVI